jgi:purine-binding chemotaxis protein CheW
MGNVVDSVSEVMNIKGGDIEKAPAFGAETDTDFILGMAKTGNGVKILLDIEKVLSTDEIMLLQSAA